MLEILLIIVLTKKLSDIAEGKGRSRSWGWIVLPLWFGGEISGGVIGAIAGAQDLGLYPPMLLCAGIGAGIAWFVVTRLSPVEYAAGFPASQVGFAPPAAGFSAAAMAAPYDPRPAVMPQAPSSMYAATPAVMPQAPAASYAATPAYAPVSPAAAAPVAAPVPVVTAPRPAAPDGPRTAGFCAVCGKNVWLLPDGSCKNGHPASNVSGAYTVG